ncbi:hypothetical protein CS006_00280 [Bifidobacterium primatium]|uniref:Gram-positive cocci surface proteins LPxTG domain-containing protein n=2 Tax=Bifidobacterium TaxID=1678 RepID=A0A2M9HA39_9BIFI|nr:MULTISPECIES: hypothetical protein [Bifidobacterium]NEG95918.1 hypothetical protein [Bifidobacterium sp. SMB2]NEH11765.1 hypothetical protein [Bifidobacterium saimiriisciurei]PJM73672.1 hypothetical protein CS006_00280 [Bifidobacterium primatium]
MTIMETKKRRLGRAAAGLLAAALTIGMAGFTGTAAASAAENTTTYDFNLSGLPAHNDLMKTSALGIVAVNSEKDVPTAVLNNGTTTKDDHTVETKYVGVKPGEYNVTYTATGDQQKTIQVGMYSGSATSDGIFHSSGQYSHFSLSIKGYNANTAVESEKVDLSPAGAYLTILGGDKVGTIHLTSTTPSQPDPQPTKSASIVGKDGEAFADNKTTLTVDDELGLSAKLKNSNKADFEWGLTQADKYIGFVDMGASPATDIRIKALKAGTATVSLTGKKSTAAEGVSATLTITVNPKKEDPKPVDPLAGFSAKERAYLEASYWYFNTQADSSKGFDGWSPKTTIYTKLADLNGLKNSVPGYSAQDGDALFHYTGANGKDQGGYHATTYKNGKKVTFSDDYDTKVVIYTGRDSGATIKYVFTTLDKVVLPNGNNSGTTPNSGKDNPAAKPSGDTTKKPAATTNGTNTATNGTAKASGLAKTGADVTGGIVAMLTLLGAGAALMLRKRA